MKAIEELTQELHRTPIGRLPAVLAAMRGVDVEPTRDAAREAWLKEKAKREESMLRLRGIAPSAGLEDAVAAFVRAPGSGDAFATIERLLVEAALAETKGNVSAAARMLHTDRKKLERKVRRVRSAR